jgi:spore germination protein YaaH
MVDLVRGQARALRTHGITMDMEGLNGAQKSAYTAFIRELAAALHADGRSLAVYSPRRVTADDARVPNFVKAYDWAALAAAADLLVVSGYNETAPATTPGPTSTAAGFQAVVDYAAQVSRTKVVPLVGQFGFSWPSAAGGARTLIATVDAEAERASLGLAGTPSDGDVAYTRPDGSVVWFETAQGGTSRIEQVRASRMAWWGMFSMGREQDAFWSVR